ncbi:MAG: TRAP transporter permease [Alphaproteobacteria bacterium]
MMPDEITAASRGAQKIRWVDVFFATGPRREPKGVIGRLIPPYAFAIACWVLYSTVIAYVDLLFLTITFLAMILVLIFLTIGAHGRADPTRIPWFDYIAAAVAVGVGLHFAINSATIMTRIVGFSELTTWNLVFGSALFLLTLEATRRTVGFGITAIVLIFVAYNLLGHLIPGTLGHGYIDYPYFLDTMAFATDGIFGVPVRVTATYAFLFVMFGTFLQRAGGGDFFFNVAAAFSGRSPGGPAKIAVVSSGLYGTISGSPTSDVVTTGAVTIPMMKRLGYSGSLAGAVEVAASTGGSILPPVMGSAAFIMAEFTGIEYREIAIAAIIPALLYYFCVYTQIHLRSVNLGLIGIDKSQIPKLSATMRQGGIFIVPLAALTGALILGYSPNFVAVYGAIAVLAVALLRKETRIGLKGIYEAMGETTMRIVPVAGACAAAGLVIGGITMTGLAQKFSSLIFLVTNQDLFLSLLVAAALTILLGMGMPTPSAYILAAVLVGPMLQELGINQLAAHLFLLYFAVLSAMTPPIAVAAYAAAALADANPLTIAAQAVRLSLSAFLVPFAFVYGQELLLIGELWQIALAVTTAVLGVWLVSLATEGYKGLLNRPARLLLAAGGLCFIVPSVQAVFLGIAFAAIGGAWGYWTFRQART